MFNIMVEGMKGELSFQLQLRPVLPRMAGRTSGIFGSLN